MNNIEKYRVNKNINLLNFFSKSDINVLKKLNIKIKNRLYSEYELDMIEEKILEYYEDDDILCSKKLVDVKVSKEEYRRLLNILDKITDELYK